MTGAYHVVTRGIADWVTDRADRGAFVAGCLARHHRGDWGDLDSDDWALNDRAVAMRAGRLLSAYSAPGELDPIDHRVWIITDDLNDPDTVTTILWPSEY
jgi:hypothetical protein